MVILNYSGSYFQFDYFHEARTCPTPEDKTNLTHSLQLIINQEFGRVGQRGYGDGIFDLHFTSSMA